MTPNSRRAAVALLAGLLLLLSAAAAAAEQPAWNLTIFHTNDTHSAFLPRAAHWRDDGRMIGGVVALSAHLAAERRTAAPDLLLDAGDFMTGNPVSRLVEDGAVGGAVARMMNALDYDAGAVGNHEFDIGWDKLEKLAAVVEHPLLAADLLLADGAPAFRAEPLIIRKNGLRVGIIGVSCAGMTGVVTRERLGPVRLVEQEGLVRALARDIDAKTDVIILLTHSGVETDRELARALEGSGIDVIVGGHSHTRIKTPEQEGGILIVQAGGNMTNLGRLDLRIEDDRVTAYDGRLIDLWADGETAGLADPAVVALADRYGRQVQAEFGQVIGTLKTDLPKGRGETAIGNFLADALCSQTGAQVGLINSGGIRRTLSAGPVTALDIQEMLPFGNALVTVRLKGDQVRAIAQTNADSGVSGAHGILQISGLSYGYRARGDKAELMEITVGGKPLDDASVYVVAMPDFVAQMTDVYLGIGPVAAVDTGVTLDEAVVRYFGAGADGAAIEGRIRKLD
jgi:5'-nucleotidase/UDP-sugar diphosphatase